MKEALEKAWRDQTPSCLTCGWTPAFHEVAEYLDRTDTPGEWHAPCVNEHDSGDCWNHRGHYLYVKD